MQSLMPLKCMKSLCSGFLMRRVAELNLAESAVHIVCSGQSFAKAFSCIWLSLSH